MITPASPDSPPRDDVGRRAHQLRADAGQTYGFLVATKAEDAVAERRALKHEGGDAEGHEERDDGDWHEADGAAAEPLDRLVR